MSDQPSSSWPPPPVEPTFGNLGRWERMPRPWKRFCILFGCAAVLAIVSTAVNGYDDDPAPATAAPAAAVTTTEPTDDTSVFDDPEIAVIALGATWEAQMPTICDNVRLALDNVDFEELYDVMSAAMFDSPSPIPRNTATEHKLRNLILACG